STCPPHPRERIRGTSQRTQSQALLHEAPRPQPRRVRYRRWLATINAWFRDHRLCCGYLAGLVAELVIVDGPPEFRMILVHQLRQMKRSGVGQAEVVRWRLLDESGGDHCIPL